MESNLSGTNVSGNSPDASGSPPANKSSKGQKKFLNYKIILGLFVIVVIIAAAVILLWPSKTNAPTSNPWGNYTSQKYHFKFTYLKAWGDPGVTKFNDKTGSIYTISFSVLNTFNSKSRNQIQSPRNVYAWLTTTDWTTTCPAAYKCTNQQAITADYVRQHVGDTNPAIVYHDSNSYATLTKQKAAYPMLQLDVFQILASPFENISAVHGIIADNIQDQNCPVTFSGSPGCISRTDFKNFDTFLKSLSAIVD